MTSRYPNDPGPYPQAPEPYPSGGYGYGPPAPRRGAGMAIAALVLGIVAIVLCWTIVGGIVLGLLAVILGVIGFRRAGRGEAAGRGRALAGVITGAVGVVLACLLLAVGISIWNSPSVQNLRTCLQNAHGDQTAIQQCQQQFQQQNTR